MKSLFVLIFIAFYIQVKAQESAFLKENSQETIVRKDGFYETINYQIQQYYDFTINFKQKPSLLMKEVIHVSTDFNESGSKVVIIEFNEFGSQVLSQLTLNNISKPIGIFLDNKNISSPYVSGPIYGGKLAITGVFSDAEFNQIVRLISSKIK